jgi:uncharacterized phage protein gp47/JayE
VATYNLRQYRDIYNAIKAYIIAHQSVITDFNEGSAISSLIEAFSRELSLLYAEARSGFSAVLTKLPYSIFGFGKHSASYATGAVTFLRSETVGNVTIPIGTLLSTAGGVMFETTEAVEMAPLEASVNAAIRAIEPGRNGDVPPGTISVVVSGLTGVDSVLNSAATAGGVNEETEAEYVARFRSYILGLPRSNLHGLITGALLNENIRSVSIVENFPPRDGLYNIDMYLDDGNGSVTDLIIAAVKAIIDGDGTVVNPGYRAAGMNIAYHAPTAIPIVVEGEVYVSRAEAEAEYDIVPAVIAYINAHTIGQDLIRAQLQKTILAFPWVVDLDITSPATNISIGDGQIARASTISLVYTQVE